MFINYFDFKGYSFCINHLRLYHYFNIYFIIEINNWIKFNLIVILLTINKFSFDILYLL